MKNFWNGFYKKASDPLKEWVVESKVKPSKSKEDLKQKSVDPQTLSSGYTPDTYWRSWP